MVLRCRDGHKSGNTAMQLQLQSVKIVINRSPPIAQKDKAMHMRELGRKHVSC